MSTYQMTFESGQPRLIEADTHSIEGELIRFYKDDKVMATYLLAACKEVRVNGLTVQKTSPGLHADSTSP